MSEVDKARTELYTIRTSWKNGLAELSRNDSLQLSPDQIRHLYANLQLDEDSFRLFYVSFIGDHDFSQEVDSVFQQLRRELDITRLKGEQNYHTEMHKQKMESLREWGQFLKNIGFNIGVFISGFVSAYLIFKFGHL